MATSSSWLRPNETQQLFPASSPSPRLPGLPRLPATTPTTSVASHSTTPFSSTAKPTLQKLPNLQIVHTRQTIQHSKFAEALRAVAPIILNKGPDNFIIIHIRNEFTNQYSTCNINDWIPPIYIRDQLVPVPPLIYERLPGGPQLYYLTLNASPPTSTLNPQPSTLNSLLITLNPKLSTLHPL